MADQLARGLFAGFATTENPWAGPNGMEQNLRLIDDHLGLYTLQAPIAPGTALPVSPNEGDGQVFEDGTYAVYNDGAWKTYPARRGMRASSLDGSDAWVNTGGGWISAIETLKLVLAGQDGASLIGEKRSLAHAVATTLHKQTESRSVNLLADYLNGAVGTAAQNTTALNNAIADLPSGGTIYIGNIKGDLLLNPITVGSPNITLVIDKATTLRWSALGATTSAITVNASGFAIKGGVLRGPSAGVYVGNENGIKMVGTSTSARKTGLMLEDVELYNFGAHAIYAQFVDRAVANRCYIHDCGYAGGMFLSCNNGALTGNTVDNITPGVSGNMYGFSLTHDSANYNTDPNAGTKLATNPFCRGWEVRGNEVSRVNWEGLDCHGAYEVQIVDNRVYATKMGISAPCSSGAAINYAGYQNLVAFNIVDGRNKDGSVSGYENSGYGINLNGGATVNSERVLCVGNIIRYKGIASNSSSGAILAVLCKYAIIANNIIEKWNGNGVYCPASSLKIIGNTFGSLASSSDTIAYCIGADTGTGAQLHIIGNHHDPQASNAANYGVYLAALTSPILYAAGNDFRKCSQKTLGGTVYTWAGSQWGNSITATSGDTTPSVAQLAGANEGTVYIPAATSYTINDFTNSFDGQEITVINSGVGTVTISRNNANLDQSTNKALAPKYSIKLKRFGNAWYQVGPLCANG